MTSGRAWKGCPPWTNLRRGPWGPPGRHDTPFSPQMDARDDLRAGLEGVPSRDHAEPQSAWPLEPATRCWFGASKNLPRRYGPREGTPSNPPSPMWHRPPRSKTRPHLRLRTDLIGHGAWTKGNRSEDGEGTLFSVVHRAERRVGAGMPPRSRIFWGASSKRQTTISWRARVDTGIAAQRAPRRQPPPPPAG